MPFVECPAQLVVRLPLPRLIWRYLHPQFEIRSFQIPSVLAAVREKAMHFELRTRTPCDGVPPKAQVAGSIILQIAKLLRVSC
jgi:hypothetical protein